VKKIGRRVNGETGEQTAEWQTRIIKSEVMDAANGVQKTDDIAIGL